MAAVRAPINSGLLAWARVEHGISTDEAARALHMQPDKLSLWEQGDDEPTLNQLRNVAALYQRTPAFFLLRQTPNEQAHRRPTDFRTLRDGSHDFGRALAREVARARARRENLLGLLDAEPHVLPIVDVVDAPGNAARTVRTALGVSVQEQVGAASLGDALTTWIQAVESLGVLVFHMSRVSPEDCRGFSIYEDVMPIIVLNGADGRGARQFTLMHELAHLLSRTSAVCDVWRDDGIEARCNTFAAELLMPRHAVDAYLRRTGEASPAALALQFKVSRSAAAVRLRSLGRMTQADLEGFLKDAREAAITQREAAKEKTGGPSPHLLKVRNLGARFVGTVLDALHDERITYVEAAQILESKVQALDKLEAELVRRGAGA